MPMAPAMASGSPEIRFDDDDDGEGHVAGDESQLNDLFSDNPEVVAQRELVAAQQEQTARENGYGPVVGRTASQGAKKLGHVQAPTRQTVEADLESIWDRPR
jgi:hypothetical protein